MAEKTTKIEVLGGVERPCLAVMHYDEDGTGTGSRVAGPKPWGGSKGILHAFNVDPDEVIKALDPRLPLIGQEMAQVIVDAGVDGIEWGVRMDPGSSAPGEIRPSGTRESATAAALGVGVLVARICDRWWVIQDDRVDASKGK